MSLPVMVWVMKHSDETLGRRLVLLALAEFAHDDGTRAFPTVETISRRARLSESQTRVNLRALEASGAIVCTGKTTKGVRIYSVLMGGPESGGGPESEGADLPTEGGRFPVERGPESTPDPGKDPGKDPGTAASPPKLVKIDGRNLGWDALAAACEIEEGSPREKSIAAALNGSKEVGPGIRRLVWERVLNDLARETIVEEEAWEDFERVVEGQIRLRAELYRSRFPAVELTPPALAKWFLDLKTTTRPTGRARAAEEILGLPELSEEERAANLERARALASEIGKGV